MTTAYYISGNAPDKASAVAAISDPAKGVPPGAIVNATECINMLPDPTDKQKVYFTVQGNLQPASPCWGNCIARVA